MRQWFSVPHKDRIELLRDYKRNGFSYNEAINDFEDSLKKFDEGGFVSESTSVSKKNPLLEKQLIDDLAYKTGLIEKYDKGNVNVDLDFRDKFGKSIHQYKYETNKAYKDKFDENIRNSTSGSIQYPMNDARRAGSINPNTAWMYPQIKDPKLRKGMESFSNEVIGVAAPIPGLQAVGKLPSILGAGKNIIKAGKGMLKGADKAKEFAIDPMLPSWNKYVTQEEKVARMLSRKDAVKAATSSQEKLIPKNELKALDIKEPGISQTGEKSINMSLTKKDNPMTYADFEEASKTWMNKRDDISAGSMADLGRAQQNKYWGISTDFKGVPEDADAIRKLGYEKYVVSKTPKERIAVENAVKNHELDHFLYKQSEAEYNDLVKSFDTNKFGMDAKYLMGKKSSIKGDELRARMGQLMDYFDFKVSSKSGKVTDAFGNTAFTEKHLDHAIKHYTKDVMDNSMSSFLGAIKDKKSFIKNMNNRALSTIPVYMYLKSQRNTKE